MSLHIEQLGHGPDVVLLHGWAMHGGVFAPLVERLRDRCTLHVVDLPGHGLSHDADVPLALDACVDAIADLVPDDARVGHVVAGRHGLRSFIRRAGFGPINFIDGFCTRGGRRRGRGSLAHWGAIVGRVQLGSGGRRFCAGL